MGIRELIFETAAELKLPVPEETLKWGEPAYRVKGGSTLRFAWKTKQPDVVSVFFNCQTPLIETFRELYREQFIYDGKRAIHLPIANDYSEAALRHCISLTLRYHSVKHLPLMGA